MSQSLATLFVLTGTICITVLITYLARMKCSSPIVYSFLGLMGFIFSLTLLVSLFLPNQNPAPDTHRTATSLFWLTALFLFLIFRKNKNTAITPEEKPASFQETFEKHLAEQLAKQSYQQAFTSSPSKQQKNANWLLPLVVGLLIGSSL